MSVSGVVVPVVTPLKKGEADVEAFGRHLERLIAAGVDGLFVCGTAGYGAWLSDGDYRAVLEKAVAVSNGRVPVLAGVLEPSTVRACGKIDFAKSCGTDEVVIIPPYYMAYDDPLPHFRECAARYKDTIVVYNIPPCTGFELTFDMVKTLVDDGLVSAVKDSSNDAELVRKLCALPVPVLQGMKPDAVLLKSWGAAGCVPVPGNIYPELFVRAWHNPAAGDQDAIDALWQATVRGYDFLRPTLAVMAHQGYGDGSVLSPMSPMTESGIRDLLLRLGE